MDMKKTQAGRSMIEMMGYLMVAMGVIIAMGKIVSSAFDNHKYSTASLQLTELVGGMVRSSAIDVDYTEVVNKVNAGDRGLIPNSYRVVGSGANTTIYHAFGGKVEVGIFDNNPEKFYVQFNNLSKKQCIELALKDWRKNQYADLFAVAVNKKYWWYWQAYGTENGSAVNLDSGKCNSSRICALPVSRVRVTGAKKDDSSAQCMDNRDNTVTWVFN